MITPGAAVIKLLNIILTSNWLISQSAILLACSSCIRLQWETYLLPSSFLICCKRIQATSNKTFINPNTIVDAGQEKHPKSNHEPNTSPVTCLTPSEDQDNLPSLILNGLLIEIWCYHLMFLNTSSRCPRSPASW